MTVKDIVTEYLKAHGYDGLAAEDCGCGLDDLMPCEWGGGMPDCKPAHKEPCNCHNREQCPIYQKGQHCYVPNDEKARGK